MNKTMIIDDVEFSVAPFVAIEGARLKAFLARNFLPSIGQIIGAIKGFFKKDGSLNVDSQIDGVALAGAVETLMAHLDEDSFINLLKRMFANVVAKGKTAKGESFMRQFDDKNFENSFNFIFQGKLFSIYPLLLFVLEVNYPDFLSMGVRNFGRLMRKTSTSEPADETETDESSNSEMSENSTQV